METVFSRFRPSFRCAKVSAKNQEQSFGFLFGTRSASFPLEMSPGWNACPPCICCVCVCAREREWYVKNREKEREWERYIYKGGRAGEVEEGREREAEFREDGSLDNSWKICWALSKCTLWPGHKYSRFPLRLYYYLDRCCRLDIQRHRLDCLQVDEHLRILRPNTWYFMGSMERETPTKISSRRILLLSAMLRSFHSWTYCALSKAFSLTCASRSTNLWWTFSNSIVCIKYNPSNSDSIPPSFSVSAARGSSKLERTWRRFRV